MYPVSAAYKAAMMEKVQRHKISGTIGGISFNASDVLRDSLIVTNQCSDKTDLQLGGVYIGVLKFTLVRNIGIQRGTWKDKEVILTFSQQIDEDSNTWEDIPVGVYRVHEANHTEKGVEITCYDNMSKLDKEYPQLTTTGTIYDIMTTVCTRCGVTFGLTREECELLPNGSEIFGIYPDNGCKTWRDIVHYIAQCIGGFATADRNGAITLRNFGKATNITVDSTQRKTGAQFSDYVTNYTGLSVVNIAEKTTRYISIGGDNGSTINLGSNPFLQYGTEQALETILNVIISTANRARYIPFSSSLVGNPAFDLGDVITFTDGTAGTTSRCCLMSYTWKLNNLYAVAGFGKNPSLATAQSKAEKNISGLTSSMRSDTLQSIAYLNSTDITIGSIQTLIIDMTATNSKSTFIDFWAELNMNVTVASGKDKAILKFHYVVDDSEEVYKPVNTYNHSGDYLMHLMNFWKFDSASMHTIRVYLEVKDGTVKFKANEIHALIKGQGLVIGKDWDGKINADDFFSQKVGGHLVNPFRDIQPDVIFDEPKKAEVEDNFFLGVRGGLNINFVDELDIKQKELEFRIVTSEGDFLVTNDGDYMKT